MQLFIDPTVCWKVWVGDAADPSVLCLAQTLLRSVKVLSNASNGYCIPDIGQLAPAVRCVRDAVKRKFPDTGQQWPTEFCSFEPVISMLSGYGDCGTLSDRSELSCRRIIQYTG